MLTFFSKKVRLCPKNPQAFLKKSLAKNFKSKSGLLVGSFFAYFFLEKSKALPLEPTTFLKKGGSKIFKNFTQRKLCRRGAGAFR